jgi:hypothetical protein
MIALHTLVVTGLSGGTGKRETSTKPRSILFLSRFDREGRRPVEPATPRADAYWKAEERAQALLRSWLSPEQRTQYDASGHFEAVGRDTGSWYRISRGRVFNVQQLDGRGLEVRSLCFTAEGLATGDINLAQKIALETFEKKALAIANRSSAPIWRPVGRRSERPLSRMQRF